jgi:hypothetical protein
MLELSDGTKSFNTVVGQAVQGQQAAYDAWVRYLQVERPLGKPSAASARVTADFARWIPTTPTGAQAVGLSAKLDSRAVYDRQRVRSFVPGNVRRECGDVVGERPGVARCWTKPSSLAAFRTSQG